MDNLPNNENKIENEELSTVFSDPTAHTEKKKVKNSKRSLKALSLLLVVAILICGTVAVIKLIPEKEEKITGDSEITVLDYEDSDIKEITVKNKNGSFNIYSKLVETEDEATGEALSETFWYLKGYDKEMTSSDALQSIVYNAVNMEAIREITSRTDKDCGLDKPAVTVKVTDNDGETFTLTVGDKSPDSAGVYVRTSKDDKIYLVGDMLDESLTFTEFDVASTESQKPITLDDKYKSYIENGVVSKVDSITISGKNFPQDIELKMNESDLGGYVPFYVSKPVKRNAENGSQMLALFSQGFDVIGAYSYDIKPETIENLGFNKPDFSVSARFEDFVYTYKFKKQSDGNYAVIGNDSKNVKKIDAENFGFLSYTTTDFYSKTIFITPINDVKNLKIETKDGSYDFSIALKEDGDSVNTYIIECDGKTYNSTYFQSYYAFLSALQCMDFEVENTTQKPELKMTFVYEDKNKEPTVIEYKKINATRYQYEIDGVAMGRIGSSSYNKIHKNLERLLAGKQIIVN
ncbi:MAG: DUF4340 domain-containing protein [Clostridia bacterium]|nr:DUF4340 domain-containing protein [Clostridia bacterium]